MFIGGVCTAYAQQAPPAQPDQSVQTPQGAASQPQAASDLSPEAQQKIVQEIRHQILMLPYYGVFDNLGFRLQGRTVILEGQVATSSLKPDTERAVKKIEGVDKVVNNIQVLPPSPMDNQVRQAVYNAIYKYPALFKYANLPIAPIRIIVKNARVTLYGVVDNETDKNMCTMRVNQVPSVLSVTNELRVVKSK